MQLVPGLRDGMIRTRHDGLLNGSDLTEERGDSVISTDQESHWRQGALLVLVMVVVVMVQGGGESTATEWESRAANQSTEAGESLQGEERLW